MTKTMLFTGAAATALLAAVTAPAVAQDALETRPANGDYQTPAFPGQTRAPEMSADVDFEVTVLAEGLTDSYSMEVLPDGRLLVGEREANALRLVTPEGEISPPVEGVLDAYAEGQGGLLDVALDPDFANNNMIYWTFSENRDDGEEGANGTTFASARLVADQDAPLLEDVNVVWRQTPSAAAPGHFGSRIAFAPDGTVYIVVGERMLPQNRVHSQDLDYAFGKVVRINADGSIPEDNPFVGQDGALPEIWSYGHRNPQSAAIDPATGELWTVEHGPLGGDELNNPEPGMNYGWPNVTYGLDYSGEPEGEDITQKDGVSQPVYYWDPVIAPSGMLFYTGEMFPEWQGSVFIGGLSSMKLVRLTMEDERVVGEEWLLADRGSRFRDVRQDADGALLVLTEEGEVLRLTAAM